MRVYSELYLNDVVENQGKLFDLVAQRHPDKNTEEFIYSFSTRRRVYKWVDLNVSVWI